MADQILSKLVLNFPDFNLFKNSLYISSISGFVSPLRVFSMELADIIKKYVLINATEHDGQAQPKSVLGKLLADNPDLRARVLELRSDIELAVEEMNRWSLERQRKELDALGGYLREERVEKKELPDLDVGREGVVVRFAPNPDGALHLGNARPAVLCDEYAKRYRGRFILRFDDTDPKIKVPEKIFYKWIRNDLSWLKIKVHKEIIASKRLDIYYKIAEDVIKRGFAYVCTCGDEWKKLRDASRPCPCRPQPNQSKRWRAMLSHKYKEGQAVLRIKTDLLAKNPAVRDWPAFRIVDKPIHPLQKKHVWPLYNFASAVDDHLLNITHIFRGQEHSTNETKQRFLYQHMKWEYPQVITLGRFSLSDMVLSKSSIREGIERRDFEGWDDPRLGTLRALKRRGFQAEAIRQIILYIGPKPSDVTIAFENLAAYNRKIIDRIANRYFFIQNPKRIDVKGLKIKQTRVALHPDADRGYRKFSLSKTFYIDSGDYERYQGMEVRLKDLCNIRLNEQVEYTSHDAKNIPKILWVPAKHIEVRIIMPGKQMKGYGEMNLAKTKVGELVQLEKFGFVRIEKISRANVTAVFSHE